MGCVLFWCWTQKRVPPRVISGVLRQGSIALVILIALHAGVMEDRTWSILLVCPVHGVVMLDLYLFIAAVLCFFCHDLQSSHWRLACHLTLHSAWHKLWTLWSALLLVVSNCRYPRTKATKPLVNHGFNDEHITTMILVVYENEPYPYRSEIRLHPTTIYRGGTTWIRYEIRSPVTSTCFHCHWEQQN